MTAGRGLLFLLPVAVGVLVGQGKAPQWASIAGVVQDAATGKPVVNAVVTLSTTGSDPEDAVARTDASGAFGFAYVPPGKYVLRANRDGYQGVWFGSESGDRPAAPMDLHAGETRGGIALRMKPLGSISGIVTDTTGHPIEHAQVVLLRRGFARGKPTWLNGQRANADEQGRYRIEGVPPGKCVLQASAQYQKPMASRSEAVYGDAATSAQAYGEQLYPRGTLDNVAPLELAPGQHLDGIDFQLPGEAAVDVKIRINGPEGGPRFANVQMMRRDGAARMNFGVPMAAENFHIQVPAGRYTAVAMAQWESKTWRSASEMDVNAPTTELTIDLSPGIDLAGRVVFEGDAKEKPRFHVRLIPGERLPMMGAPTAEADSGGKFVIHGVPPGVWDINITPVPRGGYIKSMLLGDYDVLTNEMVVATDTAAPLNIVVSARGAVVTGTVAEEAASHSRRAAVLLAPDGKYAHVFSFYRMASSDDGGQFEFKSVTPGRYRVYAFDRIEPGSWQDPEFLKPYQEQAGEAFTVAEGETVKREEVRVLHMKEEAK